MPGAIARNSARQDLAAFGHELLQQVRLFEFDSTNGNRFTFAKPLLDSDGPLTDKTVVNELAHILKFDAEPNYELIGNCWKSYFDQPPSWINFASEAKLFVGYLRDELRISEVFGPVFDSNNLSAININVAIASGTLSSIEDELNELRKMMNSRFCDLAQAFA